MTKEVKKEEKLSSSSSSSSSGNNDNDDTTATKQCHYIFTKIDQLLSHLNAKPNDIINLTAHVVDIRTNGKKVLDAIHAYFNGTLLTTSTAVSAAALAVANANAKGSNKAISSVALSVVGVAGLMEEGAVVQVEFRAVVRRGPMTSFILVM